MCLIRQAINHSISRRTFLKSAGSLAATPLMLGLGGHTLAAQSPSAAPRKVLGHFNTSIVLLGTAGGPSWWPDSDRVSASTAVIVRDKIYLVDLRHGSTQRLAQAFNSGQYVETKGGKVQVESSPFLENARALFFTHLHQDHTADYPTFLLVGQGSGLGKPVTLDNGVPVPTPIQVYGPGSRGKVEDNKNSYPVNIVTTDSGNTNPGLKEMTNYLIQAYAQTINDFTLDMGWLDFTKLFDLHDIIDSNVAENTPPDDLATNIVYQVPKGFDPNSDDVKVRCPATDPFLVYADTDNEVEVYATLVDHHQMYPSFAFRFDTPDGSVVISGDTGPDTNGNLQKLAKTAPYGTDILVHEVIDDEFIDYFNADDVLKTHLRTSHTSIQKVGGVAEETGAKKLVLNHIVPGNAPIGHLVKAKKDFSGELIIGQDLMQIGVGKAGSGK